MFFYDLKQQSTTEDQPTSGTMNTSEEMDNEIEYSKLWAKPSNFQPTPGKNEALEEFLFEVESYLFDPSNTRNVTYNLSKEEKLCLNGLSRWNKDGKNPRMFRIQDKGSRLVAELKERYRRKMLDHLEDVSIFQENNEDQCQANEKKSMIGLENGKIRNSWEVKKLSHQKQD